MNTYMKLTLIRKYKKPTYTIGELYVDGKFFSNTIEDVDRGLTSDMTEDEIKTIKVKSQTAIPRGTYEIIYTWSPKFKQRMPLLLGVKGFEAIRIHAGNSASNSAGCILVGKNTKPGFLTESKITFMQLNDMLKNANSRGNHISIEIK